MGLFRNQVGRLLRNKWPNAQLLAEELFALLSSDEPIEIDSPVIITSNTGSPPLTLRNFGSDDSMIDIVRAPPDRIDFPDIPPLTLPALDTGSITYTTIYEDGSRESGTGDRGADEPPTQVSVEGGGGGGFPGVVVSGGPGDSYQVNVYENGLSEAPIERTVTQLSIAADATIPVGTWALVGKVGETYFMQVPVWLEDVP